MTGQPRTADRHRQPRRRRRHRRHGNCGARRLPTATPCSSPTSASSRSTRSCTPSFPTIRTRTSPGQRHRRPRCCYLVVNNSVPAKSFGELTALAKAKPGQLNYGSSGIGSIHHLATEALKSSLGLNIVHVPYKGTGEMVPALLGGQVAIGYAALPSIEAHIKAGRVRIRGGRARSSARRACRMCRRSPRWAFPATSSRP